MMQAISQGFAKHKSPTDNQIGELLMFIVHFANAAVNDSLSRLFFVLHCCALTEIFAAVVTELIAC